MGTPTFVILIVCFATLAVADDFRTTKGKEYKDATVSRVEPDGIVLKTKSGISKVYFAELPKEVQERFHYNPNAAADLMDQAESALRTDQFGRGAELLNRILSEYPSSPQAQTVRDLRSFLRDKQPMQDGPLTSSEAQRLRAVMDALVKIKQNYRTATPEKRRALETLLGAETFRDTNNGLGSLSSSGAKLRDGMDNRAAGCLDIARAKPALDNAAARLDASVAAAKRGDSTTAASEMRSAAASLRTAASALSADAAISQFDMRAAEAYDKAAAAYASGDEHNAALYAAAAIGFVQTSIDALGHSSVPRCH